MKANIFFFVTTIAVIVFLILGSVVLYYVIRVVRNIAKATDNLDKRIDKVSEDVEEMQHRITESFLFNMIFFKKKKKVK